MDTKQQPEALRLAEMLTADEWPGNVTIVSYARECVAELLRQHSENETLRAGYAAARLEIESLRSQAPQQAAQANSELEDAARYRLLRRGQHWSVIDGIGNDLRAEALDAAVDAKRKQGEKQ